MTESLFRLQRRVDYYLFDLILLGCVADPIIYAVRMRPVRLGYARIWNSVVQSAARLCLRGPRSAPAAARGRAVNRSNEAGSSITETGGRRSNYTATSTFV